MKQGEFADDSAQRVEKISYGNLRSLLKIAETLIRE
jgi:hypothetical protein